jgi:hypothetical protein
MKCRRIRWARHIVCTERQDAHKILVGNPERRKPTGKIILQGISQKLVTSMWTGFNWLMIGSSGRIL